MALIKKITLDNGVDVNYHRIVRINNITNIITTLEIASYTSKEKRKEEKEKISENKPMNIFINTKYLNLDYDENMNIENAYEYLKALDDFKNAEDDL